MQSAMLSSTTPTRTGTSIGAFKPVRAALVARKQVIVAAQGENKARNPAAQAAGALLAAVAAAQLALTGPALAVDPPVLSDVPKIFSPKDAQDQKTGKGQSPSDKYVEQAKQFTSETAASKIADPPTINKKGGGVGRADFAPSQQPGVKAAAGKEAPMDIRGGTPAKTAGWLNALPDMSAAPLVSKDAEAANDGKANLPKPGGVSKAVSSVGKAVTEKLPNAPDISNPKGAQNVPTASKLAKAAGFLNSSKIVADLAEAPLGDNAPNFPTPDVNPSNNQDVFKQLGDKIRGAEPNNIPSPGKVGEGIASNVNGPDAKGAVKEVSKNLPEIAQKTDIAPESVGAKANARN